MRGRTLLLAVVCACRAGAVIDDGRVPVAIVGDSDSHSYHDSLTFSGGQRGGAYRAVTYQWTEIWARLRPGEVDLGAWGRWGTRGSVALLRGLAGLEQRAPPKIDFRHNLAFSGAKCSTLVEGMTRQVQPLVRMMDRDSLRWARGIVVVRIGINSVGKPEHLSEYAVGGLTTAARARIRTCTGFIADALRRVRTRHPTTHIVLVGIADDAQGAELEDRWRDPSALANIADVLDLFDADLRALAARDSLAAFLDDRAWFRRLWGGRGASGNPAYRAVGFGGPESVTNSQGDHPKHLALADGHAGTVANGLWLRDLIDLIESEWGLGLTPIDPGEIVGLADPDGEFGLAPQPPSR